MAGAGILPHGARHDAHAGQARHPRGLTRPDVVNKQDARLGQCSGMTTDAAVVQLHALGDVEQRQIRLPHLPVGLGLDPLVDAGK